MGMKRIQDGGVLGAALVCAVFLGGARGVFSGPVAYSGRNLGRISFPVGGLGTGAYFVEGNGAIGSLSVRHRMEFFNEPRCFAAVTVLGEGGAPNTARVLEGPVPEWKYFNRPGAARGYEFRTYGLPRFRECAFTARFPFAEIRLADRDVPVTARLTAWSPFVPGDMDASGLPAGALEYAITNPSGRPVKAVFSFSSYNVLGGGGSIGPVPGGFVCYSGTGAGRAGGDAFAFFADSPGVRVNHTWFRGGWWDPIQIAWEDVRQARMIENPPTLGRETGATLSLPLDLAPGETKTVVLNTCWYVPESGQRYGSAAASSVPAFGRAPSSGTGRLQQTVSGFLGGKLVNTYDGTLDAGVGTLTSPLFTVGARYLSFLCGGGSDVENTAVQLIDENGRVVASSTGEQTERLSWRSHDISAWKGRKLAVRIVDNATGGWGHILADHFILSDAALGELLAADGRTLKPGAPRHTVLQDFEKGYGDWAVRSPAPDPAAKAAGGPDTYRPWYASIYGSVLDVAKAWREKAPALRARSRAFADAVYSQSLPQCAVDAVTANLAILKSPTLLRQHDGRLWGWEGCNDEGGSCVGTCSHVWNYAQALSHLFPAGERSFRDTQFFFGQMPDGRQAFRKNLPISYGGAVSWAAADGQCGEIMSVHREWRICGDVRWLARFWPKVRAAMDYAIRTWDPGETGLLTESHHNTYDINYFGPDGHCSSFYLGALKAAVLMGEALGRDVSRYRALLAKGVRRFETELYNGEYFVQLVETDPAKGHFEPLNPAGQGPGYRKIVEEINRQGPKYQYGAGCLSDGVLGLWIARVCGIDGDIVDPAKVRSHLLSVFRYNFRRDLSGHANPQRPSYAMGSEGGLLLCSWPRGGRPHLPFVYSDEVWTGIEYQVASHLMLMGETEKGMEIVKACRARYDGARRNPFDEIECGHFYARAMASYAIIQGYFGLRYDAVDRTLHFRKGMPNARAFLAADTGFGLVTTDAAGVPALRVIEGEIPVARTVAE